MFFIFRASIYQITTHECPKVNTRIYQRSIRDSHTATHGNQTGTQEFIFQTVLNQLKMKFQGASLIFVGGTLRKVSVSSIHL